MDMGKLLIFLSSQVLQLTPAISMFEETTENEKGRKGEEINQKKEKKKETN
jgi:hypothetical protein